jgi:signal transduction histidine kinase
MQQVFLNLILNARDAMPDGGKLRISLRQEDGFVDVVFEDTGPGIEPEVRGKIFDPFFTTKRSSKGTGLGLSLSYSIIKDHGGSLELVNVPVREEDGDEGEGAGCRFIIRLPIEGDGQDRGALK